MTKLSCMQNVNTSAHCATMRDSQRMPSALLVDWKPMLRRMFGDIHNLKEEVAKGGKPEACAAPTFSASPPSRDLHACNLCVWYIAM